MKVTILSCLLLMHNLANGQCSLQVTDSASVIVNDQSIGTLQWNSPMNAISADSLYTVAGSGFQFNLCTNYLKATDFGFSLPSTATICGIEVKIKRTLTDGAGKDSSVKIVQANNITGSDYAYSIPWTLYNDTVVTYGGNTDLWYGGWPPMSNWTPALINDTGFGVAIACEQDWALTLFNVDQITISVYYDNAGGISKNNFDDNITIVPNPFYSQTVLQTDNSFHNATLSIDNCFGQTVKQMKNISGQTVTLSRDNLPSGLYFLRLTEGNKAYTDKLVLTDN